MHPQDVPKTTFGIHEVWNEFLVMPSGLKKFSFLFQVLINYIFKPFVRKFIMTLFDECLIYSNLFDKHLSHLWKT